MSFLMSFSAFAVLVLQLSTLLFFFSLTTLINSGFQMQAAVFQWQIAYKLTVGYVSNTKQLVS